jgi:hypothetical protein
LLGGLIHNKIIAYAQRLSATSLRSPKSHPARGLLGFCNWPKLGDPERLN